MDSHSASSASKRGFSTKYDDHVGLVVMLCHQASMKAFKFGIEYAFDDAMQDAYVVYLKALKTYDQERGITFSAYLGRAIVNEHNAVIQKAIDERKNTISAEELNTEDSDLNVLENIEAPNSNVEEILAERSEMAKRVKSLSPLAKKVIKELNSPSDDFNEFIQKKRNRALAEKALGKRFVRFPKDATFSLIVDYMGLTDRQWRVIRKELETNFGIEL